MSGEFWHLDYAPEFFPEDGPWVVVIGPAGGTTHVGPFRDHDEVVRWASACANGQPFYVDTLVKPEDYPGAQVELAEDADDQGVLPFPPTEENADALDQAPGDARARPPVARLAGEPPLGVSGVWGARALAADGPDLRVRAGTEIAEEGTPGVRAGAREWRPGAAWRLVIVLLNLLALVAALLSVWKRLR